MVNDQLWNNFQELEQLSPEQTEKFKRYCGYLQTANQECNLTSITETSGIIKRHFQDSLALRKVIDLSKIAHLCDIGTGAGFPALPLKIFYPHLTITLIEVTHKKRAFLEKIIAELGLENITILSCDWRTFLKKTELNIDLFVTRAALHEDELCRMFQPSSPYKNSMLVYWAAISWQPVKKATPFLQKLVEYKVGRVKSNLAFFANHQIVI